MHKNLVSGLYTFSLKLRLVSVPKALQDLVQLLELNLPSINNNKIQK